MAVLHILNISHDYALASFSPYYTPPASVERLERAMREMPRGWAAEDDYVWGDSFRPDHITEIRPWGWNPMLRRRLLDAGLPTHLMPDDEHLEAIRRLSHRRLTIPLNRHILASFPDLGPDIIPAEITVAESGMEAYAEWHALYFKAPWSSSGRGVIRCADLGEKHVRPWLSGMIRRQGSVMMEREADRILDCASLWICRGGKTSFRGWSLFETSPRGKYLGNIMQPQAVLADRIQSLVDIDIHRLAECQQKWLDREVAPFYDGPLGIDMMALRDRRMRPAVELNLRNTMGHAALAILEKKSENPQTAYR